MIRKYLRKIYKCIRPIIRRIDSFFTGEPIEEKRDPVQRFNYQKPGQDQQGAKEIVTLCKNRRIRGAVHILREGSPDHLHSHSTIDGFWYVLKGNAVFHGEGDTIYGEIGENEGILTPKDTRYWYESAGEEDLELLQVLAINPEKGWHRENYEDAKFDRSKVKHLNACDISENPVSSS
jgi:mannose-6-phosphate isomerase-like protein (cupin superfamily)